MLQPVHPARDILHPIIMSTDSTWRKKHLEDCLSTYYSVFSKYLKTSGIEMSFDELKQEVFARWGMEVLMLPQFGGRWLPEGMHFLEDNTYHTLS